MSSKLRNTFLLASLILLLLPQLLSACLGVSGVDNFVDGDEFSDNSFFNLFEFSFFSLIGPVFGLSVFVLLTIYAGGRFHQRRFHDLTPDSDALTDLFLLFVRRLYLYLEPLLFPPPPQIKFVSIISLIPKEVR